MGSEPDVIRRSIVRDMSEGVMTVGMNGRISSLNPAAEKILGLSAADTVGKTLAGCFFERPENDEFCQTILDAVYDTTRQHHVVVPFFAGEKKRQLHVMTSFLKEEGKKIGLIVVFSDISELVDLRDSVKAMNAIRRLNEQLSIRNKLISATFGRFLSDDIVSSLLETPGGLQLGGRKRVLTVMMSDIRGFTAISERMDAEPLLSMLNHYLGKMTEIIQKRNGTIIEFIGDGIMAVFGAPNPVPAHAADACAAAVEMQAAMAEVNRWNRENGYPELEMGIGLNTGEMIVGNLGSEKRTKYGVVGNQVNLCGRIESYTVGGQILASPAVRRAAGVPLEIREETEVFPKGAEHPIVLSEITAVGAPYDVRCEGRRNGEPPRLASPVPVRFSLIRQKHCDLVEDTGTLTALDAENAVLETGAPLRLFDNLQLDAGGQLFAKILERRAAGGPESGTAAEKEGGEGTGAAAAWFLRFTSKPPGFDAWRSRVTKENGG